jgi:hypothetical protein
MGAASPCIGRGRIVAVPCCMLCKRNSGRTRSPNVPADPPPDGKERVEGDEAGEATGSHAMPRHPGSVGESIECRHWGYGGPSHEAPHLYDGLMMGQSRGHFSVSTEGHTRPPSSALMLVVEGSCQYALQKVVPSPFSAATTRYGNEMIKLTTVAQRSGLRIFAKAEQNVASEGIGL